jgi:hypothetical protein
MVFAEPFTFWQKSVGLADLAGGPKIQIAFTSSFTE